jgi:hypothetical protein
LLLFLIALRSDADVKESDAKGVTVDWTRGLVVATETRVADLRAPNPLVARVRAERLAREGAEKLLLAAAKNLRYAGKKPKGAAKNVEALARHAIPLSVVYASDGSATVTGAIALETVRTAFEGPSPPPTAEESGPTALIIDARGVLKQPALGYVVVAGVERYAGPALFVDGEEAKGVDLGARAVRAKALKASGRDIAIAEAELVANARAAGALIVFIVGGK